MEVGQKRPNVIVTGTPGVGKTTFGQMFAEHCGMVHLDVARLVREEKLYIEWDDEMQCSIFDEELVLDALRSKLNEGGHVIDFHSVGFLNEEDFALIVVLRTDNTVLYDRLKSRGYSDSKITSNVECEIFQSVLDEAQEAFEDSKVEILQLQNDEVDQLQSNVERVAQVLANKLIK